MSTTTATPRLTTRYRKRLTGEERLDVGRRIATDYRQGASIRGVAASADLSYGTARQLLLQMGVQLRGRGGVHPGARRKKTAAAE